jgi:hypothetical protein
LESISSLLSLSLQSQYFSKLASKKQSESGLYTRSITASSSEFCSFHSSLFT